MKTQAKAAEAKCNYAPLESASFDEYGYLPGEALSARLVRLDGDLVESIGMLGARDEPPTEPASIGAREPDWCSLTLEVFAPLHALLVSHVAMVPYGVARDAVGLQQDYQSELAEAFRRVGVIMARSSRSGRMKLFWVPHSRRCKQRIWTPCCAPSTGLCRCGKYAGALCSFLPRFLFR